MHSRLSTIVKDGGARPLRKWGALLALVAAAASAILYWTIRNSDARHAPAYVTAPVRRGDLSVTIIATGNLEPTNQVTVGSELSGTVSEVLAEANDRVAKGQKLAVLDTAKLSQQTERSRAVLASSEAGVAQAEATLREARANLARLRELHRISGGRTPSKAELDRATAAADRAAADLLSARAAVSENQAAVRANESDLAKAVIVSPVEGIVLNRNVEPGQTVAAQFTAPEFFVIAENLDTMNLKVAVAEADISSVRAGQTASFTVDAWPGRTYAATVTRVSFGSTITDNVVTYPTELAVSNQDLSLRPGMTATVDITIDRRTSVLLVPSAALRFEPRGPATTAAPAPRKTFLQSLVPGPPRRPRRNHGPADNDHERQRPAATAQVWLLKEGRPVPLPVTPELTDGRQTAVSGETLAEGQTVILRESSSPFPAP